MQRYKKNPESCPFPTDYFPGSIKNIKIIPILQYLLYLCKMYPRFRKSDSALGEIYFELRLIIFSLKTKNIYP